MIAPPSRPWRSPVLRALYRRRCRTPTMRDTCQPSNRPTPSVVDDPRRTRAGSGDRCRPPTERRHRAARDRPRRRPGRRAARHRRTRSPAPTSPSASARISLRRRRVPPEPSTSSARCSSATSSSRPSTSCRPTTAPRPTGTRRSTATTIPGAVVLRRPQELPGSAGSATSPPATAPRSAPTSCCPARSRTGPYPTVVEYSGYTPSDPDSAGLRQDLFTTLGYAYVGVNMRGTGCSGGSFDYFEYVQSLDGYDAIEAVAAQPWVLDNEVGMVGISYPGISQLFVAQTQPPSLVGDHPAVGDRRHASAARCTPAASSTPASPSPGPRIASTRASPYGQDWAAERIDAGDDVCADNQKLRLQNPDLSDRDRRQPVLRPGDRRRARADHVRRPDRGADVPRRRVAGRADRRPLPDDARRVHRHRRTSTPRSSTGCTPSRSARGVPPLRRVPRPLRGQESPRPRRGTASSSVLGGAMYGRQRRSRRTPNRFEGLSYDEALAAFEAEPSVRVCSSTAAPPACPPGPPSRPQPSSSRRGRSHRRRPRSWILDGNGTLTEQPLVEPGTSTYTADPAALPARFYTGDSNDIWKAGAAYDWQPLPDGTGLGFITPPLSRRHRHRRLGVGRPVDLGDLDRTPISR